MIEVADLADSTKRKYTAVLRDYLATGAQLTDRAALVDFAAGLSTSRRAQLKAAVKLWTQAMINEARAVATPDNLPQVDAAIHRFTSLQTAVTVKAAAGEKAHTWLTRPEVTQLLDAARATAGDMGWRDVLALALLVGAGLRREEAVSLTFDDMKMQPVKGRLRAVLAIAGKGKKNRVVPISDKLAGMIDTWGAAVGSAGLVLRSVDKSGAVGIDLSAVGLFQIVRGYGRAIDKPRLAPHDLRRTYAQIGYESGVPITQISKLLGHASVATTQRYLNLDLDLETTISDFIPL
jgi:integrase